MVLDCIVSIPDPCCLSYFNRIFNDFNSEKGNLSSENEDDI